MKTVLYARSSIKSQEHSISSQIDAAKEKAKRMMMVIDHHYIDEAVSARKTEAEDRTQYHKLVQGIKSGEISTLFVYKRDRLSRRVKEYMTLYELLKEKQVKVIFTASNELELQYSPAGEFFELVMAGFNQREAELINQRIMETKLSIFREGKHPGGVIPYGYKTDEKHVLDKSEDISTVEKIFIELFSKKFPSLGAFVKHLIINDIKRNDGTPFTYGHLKSLISCTWYKGLRQMVFFDETFDYQDEKIPILSPSQWEHAQEILESMITKKPQLKKNIKFLLEGVLFCDLCKKALSGRANNKSGDIISYYRCKKKEHWNICVNREYVEQRMLEEASEAYQQIITEAKSLPGDKLKKELELDLREIMQVNKEIQILTLQISKLSKEWLLTKTKIIQDEILLNYKKLESKENLAHELKLQYEEKQRRPERAKEIEIKLLSAVKNSPPEKQKDLLNNIVRHAYVNMEKIRWSYIYDDIGKDREIDVI